MTTNNCLYYDPVLQKTIPCFIVPGTIYTINNSNEKYCKILYDYNNFINFNVTANEVARYSSDTIRIIDIYPNTTSEQFSYAQACIPNLISNQSTFEIDELNRMYALVTMLVNVSPLQPNFFYNLADFISYDILFTYLTDAERQFMAEISNVAITSVPTVTPSLMCMLNMCNTIFTAFPVDNTQLYYIQNIKNLAAFTSITFPIPLNIPILKQNIAYLVTNLPS